MSIFDFGDWQRYAITNVRRGALDARKLGPKWWQMSGTGCLFSWTWDLGECGIWIPPGYQCDGASIPKPFRDVVDPETAFDWSWPHDLLYEAHGGDRPFRVWNDDGTFSTDTLRDYHTGVALALSKERADALLVAGWIASGMRRREALAGYAAVRQFGAHAWESLEPTGASIFPVAGVAA